MTPSEFFNEHTYYKWQQLVDNETCANMAEQVRKAYSTKLYYEERPGSFDFLAQRNTNHIEKQGYSRKYRAIYGENVKNMTPLIYEYYTNPQLIELLSNVVNCPLYTVPAYKTVDQAIQIYNQKGDGTNWHHDRCIFNGGRVFTFLTVIHNTSDQELTVWTEANGIEKLKWSVGMAVIIEKFKTFHSVTPLTFGERYLVTLTYCEKPYSPSILRPVEYIANKSKNFSYLGFDAFTLADWVIIITVIILIITAVYAIIVKWFWLNNKLVSRKNKKK